MENKVIIRVQTTPDYSPQDAFTNAITDLLSGKFINAEFIFFDEKMFFCRIITFGRTIQTANERVPRGQCLRLRYGYIFIVKIIPLPVIEIQKIFAPTKTC